MKAEVIAMSIYGYNEEYMKKTLFEDGIEAGYNQRFAEGKVSTPIKSVETVMENLKTDVEKAQ